MRAEQEAGAMHYIGMRAAKGAMDNIALLHLHIKQMIEGTSDFDGPLWGHMELTPDAKIVKPGSIEEYLFSPPRNGLGIPSPAWLEDTFLMSRYGQDARRAITGAIPEWDEMVEHARQGKPRGKGVCA